MPGAAKPTSPHQRHLHWVSRTTSKMADQQPSPPSSESDGYVTTDFEDDEPDGHDDATEFEDDEAEGASEDQDGDELDSDEEVVYAYEPGPSKRRRVESTISAGFKRIKLLSCKSKSYLSTPYLIWYSNAPQTYLVSCTPTSRRCGPTLERRVFSPIT